MIVLVTGSRYANYDVHASIIRRTLEWVVGLPSGGSGVKHELWDGSAEGADTVARRIAVQDFDWGNRPFTANWPACDEEWRDPLTGMRPCLGRSNHRKQRSNRTEFCPVAGFRRNQLMVDQLVGADGRKVCVAFPIPDLGSHGTADCLTRAWRANVPTIVIPLIPAA